MIRFSRMADYAVVLVCEMLLEQGKIFSASNLSRITDISEHAIMKILKLLHNNNVVASVRGKNGGYLVNKKPKDITILDIVYAIDGPVALTVCSHKSNTPCDFEKKCITKHGWINVNNALQNTLASFTIADFMGAYRFSL